LFIVSATYLRVLDALPADANAWQRLWKGAGLVLLVLGTAQIVGAASGAHDVLRPLARLASDHGASEPGSLAWRRVQSIDELDAALADANGKPIMLDFYADWCVSCTEMDRYTFADPRIVAKLAGLRLLRVDVTANSAQDKALLKRFHLFGPPGAVFLDRQGGEVRGTRVIGFESVDQFLISLARGVGQARQWASVN